MRKELSYGKECFDELNNFTFTRKMEDEELNKLAREELLLDTKRAAVRAEMVGAHGWAKPPPTLKANKRFLNTMMLNTVGSSSAAKKPLEIKGRNNRRFSRQVTRLVCKSPPQKRKQKSDNSNLSEKSKSVTRKLPSDSKKSHSRKSSKPRKKKSRGIS